MGLVLIFNRAPYPRQVARHLLEQVLDYRRRAGRCYMRVSKPRPS